MIIKPILTAATLVFSSISLGCPNWQANTNNSQISGWDYQLNPQNILVVADPKDSDSQITKLTITPNSTWPA